jgi:hypothetical protein
MHGSAFLANAPLGIVVIADSTKSPKQEENLQYNKIFLNQYGNLLNTP